jgi:hypothetical protein
VATVAELTGCDVTPDESVPPFAQPTKPVRLVQHAAGVTAYPQPYQTPVLPRGWAPLETADQQALLNACDLQEHSCRLRLGSPWDPGIEYRVYALESDVWHGVCAATVFSSRWSPSNPAFGNTRLLAIAKDVADAVLVTLDFLNWDLEAEGARWRLALVADSTASPR